MRPEEKARELVEKFYTEIRSIGFVTYREKRAKSCATVCVDEIIKSWKEDGNRNLDESIVIWWQKVKQEINNTVSA